MTQHRELLLDLIRRALEEPRLMDLGRRNTITGPDHAASSSPDLPDGGSIIEFQGSLFEKLGQIEQERNFRTELVRVK